MGKLFIKIGKWMQVQWCKFQCWWNSILLCISFKNVEKCPNKFCTCKK